MGNEIQVVKGKFLKMLKGFATLKIYPYICKRKQ